MVSKIKDKIINCIKLLMMFSILFQSLRFCLLFCANGGDLVLRDLPDDSSFRSNSVQFKIGNENVKLEKLVNL